MTVDIAALLGKDGEIAQNLDGYEVREEQIQMSLAVQNAMKTGRHLIVEAGTGVGKSFAYLLPCIEHCRDSETKVIVSTHTISLQEQLLYNDVPFLKATLPLEFSAVLVKGRQNYLCLRRLAMANTRQGTLFSTGDDVDELGRIWAWSSVTRDGSLSDLGFVPRRNVWSSVSSEHGNCLGRGCNYNDKCFYQRARRRSFNADILIVNHHLFFSDLSLREQGVGFLPDYGMVVLDEAHCVESVASEHMGRETSNLAVKYLLNRLYNEKTGKGFLMHSDRRDTVALVSQVRGTAERFFDEVLFWLHTDAPKNGRIMERRFVANDLSRALRELGAVMASLSTKSANKDDEVELKWYSSRTQEMADSVEQIVEQPLPDYVYWVELSGQRQQRIALTCAPLHVGPRMKNLLFDGHATTILTSATLAVGRDKSFDYVEGRLGLDECDELWLGSPFDFMTQVTIHVPSDTPEPADDENYIQTLADKVMEYLELTSGRAFVLFTSYRLMNEVFRRLESFFAENGFNAVLQGDSLPRHRMLERFKQQRNSVLFGTDSFWQGVDVRGETLSNVIITKLPFGVPSRPLAEARMEEIEARGGNAFLEYNVPEAIIKFKQGFGRLVRTKRDRGIVVILDSRVLTRDYGRLFLESLPECRMVMESPG